MRYPLIYNYVEYKRGCLIVNNCKIAPDEVTSKDKCCHYWVIETPEGPVSKGICKFCGEEKEFDSFGPDSASRWDRSTSKPASPHGKTDPAPVGEQDEN